MRKLVNDPFDVVDEMVAGVLAAFPGRIAATASRRGLVRADPGAGARGRRRTGVIVGGGSGHEPAFLGYLGPGLADGVAIGNVFASPAATPVVEVARAVPHDDGVLFLYGNYEGDVMNFDMAAELLAEEGIGSATCLVTDDVASAPAEARHERRGVAGGVFVFKAACARADEGAGLADVLAAAHHANDRVRSVGVGLGPCIVPAAGVATFDLPEGDMDVGMGVHGEAGIQRIALEPADAVADRLLDLLLRDRPPRDGESVAVLVNLLGSTPLMEGYVVLRRVAQRLEQAGVRLHRALVGPYLTSLEMAGASLSLLYLDDELTRLIDAPCAPLMAPALGGAA